MKKTTLFRLCSILLFFAGTAFGDYSAGLDAYRKAWDSYSKADYAKAAEETAAAIRLDPENPHAHALAGDIAYRMDDLAGAVAHWNKALQVDPRLREIEQQIEQVALEQELEKSAAVTSSAAFVVRTPRGSRLEPDQLIKELEAAQRFLEQKLDFQFSGPVTVLVYEPKQFYADLHVPTEVAGLFDGKIRIPLRPEGQGTPFREVLWHETAHAAVHQLTAGKAPRWLQEGIAQLAQAQIAPIFTGDLQIVLRANDAPTLRQLVRSSAFVTMDAGVPLRTNLFYQASWAYCAYFVEQRGWEGLRHLLTQVRSEEPPDQALANILGLKSDELERQWVRWARQRLSS